MSDDSDDTDITTKLRQTRANMLGTDDEEHYWACHDAANEIDALRKELDAEARINGMGGEREARLMAIVAEKESEIARLRLTDAEREALETATAGGVGHVYARRAATLRGLLERLGGER